MTNIMHECTGCGQRAKYFIALAVSPSNAPVETERYYIPNDFVRANGAADIKEVPFCGDCMRAVEDNLRATILGLQVDHGLLAVKRQP